MKLTINPDTNIQENKVNCCSPIIINLKNFLETNINISEIEKKDNLFETINSCNFESLSINEQNSLKRDEKSIIAIRIKKKLSKEDLYNIPLPIFSCIYCSNEKIVYNHLINENLSKKYYLQTSIYDIKLLDKIIISTINLTHDEKTSLLCEIILNNTEFLKHYYNRKELNDALYSNIINKFSKANAVAIKNYFIGKIKYEIRKKRDKKFMGNKYNSNQFFTYKQKKILKPINNNIFYTKNFIINKNIRAKIIGTNLSRYNEILSLSDNRNIDVNKYSSRSNKKIKKIIQNKECGYREKRKFLDIFLEEKINLPKIKNNIIFDDKIYDIWNPNITFLNEENEEIKNKNPFYNIDDNQNTKKLNAIKFKKKLLKLNCNINQYKKEKNEKNNYNDANISNKKFEEEINFFTSNNVNKNNLFNYIKNKNRRDINIIPLLFKNDYSTGNSNNYTNNIDLINKIYSSRNIGHNDIQDEQNSNMNLSNINDKDKGNNKFYLKKLIRKSLLPICNFSPNQKNKEISSQLFDMNVNDIKCNNRYFRNNLERKERYDINLEIELNNIKKKTFPKYTHRPSKSLLKYSLKNKNCFSSLPNLNIKLSSLREKSEKRIVKINSYHFLPKKSSSLSRKYIKRGNINVNKLL